MPEKDYIEDYVLDGKHKIEEHEFEEKKVPERPRNLFQNYIGNDSDPNLKNRKKFI